MSNYLVHYGTPRHSGRYPWGSGKEPYQSLTRSKSGGVVAKDELYYKNEKERHKAIVDSSHGIKKERYEKIDKLNKASKVLLGVGASAALISMCTANPLIVAPAMLVSSSSLMARIGITGYKLKDEIVEKQENKKTDAEWKEEDGPPKKLKELKKKKKLLSSDDDVKLVNPNSGMPGSTENCVYSAIAYDMRRRGYDVQARQCRNPQNLNSYITKVYSGAIHRYIPSTTSTIGTSKDVQNNAYKNTLKSIRLANEVYKNKSNTSRGIVAVKWKESPCGHCFNYEYDNGKITFYDPQVGDTGSLTDAYFSHVDPNGIWIYRTDTLKPNDNIGEAVINRKE